MTTATPSEATQLLPRSLDRWHVLIDVLYLTQVTWLYVFSLLYPLVGLFYGILLLAGSVSDRSKRIGRVCLILGIVNTVLIVVALVGVLVLGLTGALTGILTGD